MADPPVAGSATADEASWEPQLRLDAVGLACPAPIIKLARAVAGLPAGTLVEISTDDPAARHDVPAWCHLRGVAYLGAVTVPRSGDGPTGTAEPVLRHHLRV